MPTESIKHICSKCYGLDKFGNCIPCGGIRKDNVNMPRECDKYHPAIMMLWYLAASTMNPNFKKSEIAILIILGTMLFYVILTFLMVFDMIPFFTVVWK